MAVYCIVDVKIHDPESYAEYKQQVGPLVARYGGTFLVCGGVTSTIEGDWQPERLVVIEFGDAQRFTAWYDSPEYTEVRKIRFNASSSRALLAHGTDEEGSGS